MRNPFRYFNSSLQVIRLTVMLYIRYPLSLLQVEDLLKAESWHSYQEAKSSGTGYFRASLASAGHVGLRVDIGTSGQGSGHFAGKV